MLGRLDREPVHHLDRGRHDAGADDALHGSARGVHGVERREQRAHRLRHADEPERDARDDAQRPLRADDDADEVRPVGVERLAAQLDELAVREHEREPGHVVCGEAVLEAVGAARVLRDVPADRADLLARRVGRVEESVRRDGARHVEVRNSRLDDDPLAREVDLEDAVHPRQRDDDASGDRRRASGEACTGAARDERDAFAMAGAQHRLDVLRRSGKGDELGNGSVARQPVALVDAKLLRLGDDVLAPERAPQLVDEGGREGHAATIGLPCAADRATREDRLRRAQLQRPCGGAGRRAADGAAPVRQVAVLARRPWRRDRHPVDRLEGRLRGRARRRHRRAREGRLEGERVRGRARLRLRERRQRARSPVLATDSGRAASRRTRSARSGR